MSTENGDILTDKLATVFDENDLLDRLMGDRELANEVIIGFLADMPKQLGILRDFLAKGEMAGIRRQAHSLRGAAANVGAYAFRQAASEVEAIASDGESANLSFAAERLDIEFGRLNMEIKSKGWGSRD